MPFFGTKKREEMKKEVETPAKRKMDKDENTETGEKTKLKKKFRVAGWKRVKKDFLVREFWPLKPLFFLLFSSIVALLPFMTLHMRVLGFTDEETGYIMAIFPIFSLLTPFVFTTIADKVGNFKWLLFGLLVLTSLNGLLFLLVPKGRSIIRMPPNINFELRCSSDLPFQLDNSIEHCVVNMTENALLEFGACGYVCEEHLGSDTVERFGLQNQTYERNRIFYKDINEVGIFCKNNFCEIRRESENGLVPWIAKNVSVDGEGDYYTVTSYEFDNDTLSQPNVKCQAGESAELFQPLKDSRCLKTCFMEGIRSDFCKNKNYIIDLQPVETFWLYTFIRVLFAVTLGGSMILFEGAAMSVVMQYKGDIALQRVYGIIGAMGFAAFSGWMIDTASRGLPDKDFTPAFYLYAVMVGFAAILVLVLDLNFKPPATHFIRDVKLLVTNVEMIALFVATIFSGLFWGYFETFLFWFLEDLGGSSLLMGLTLTVSGASGVPFLIMFEPLWRKIGLINIYVAGFLVYIVRFVGYAYLQDPWVCLVYEAMEAVTTQLMTTCMVQYAANLATQTTMATAQGLVAKAYYAIGRALGSMAGGQLIGAVGHRTTFKILSVASAISAVAYFAFQQLYLNRVKEEEAEKQRQLKGEENPTFKEENESNETAMRKVADEMIDKLGVDFEYGTTGVDNIALETDENDDSCNVQEVDTDKSNPNKK